MLKFGDVYEESGMVIELKNKGMIFTPDNYITIDKRLESEYYRSISARDWFDKRVLITGITGFAGSHLAEQLLEFGAEVYGLVRRHAVPYYENLEDIKTEENLFLVDGDITSFARMEQIINDIEPTNIFHLAAESFVPTSFNEPSRVVTTNAGGTANILEAIRRSKIDPKISVACSSEQYGLVKPEEVPVTEEQPFRPRSTYGVTKVATELLAKQYHYSYGLKTLITRAFNHEGPRRGFEFVTSVIHKQIVRIHHNLQNHIVIGNPNAVRDFTHVFDTIRAYMLLHIDGEYGEPYNICSGMGVTIGDYVKIAKQIFNINCGIFIDEDRMRPSDVPLLIGDHTKFSKLTGWNPVNSIVDIMEDGYNYIVENPWCW